MKKRKKRSERKKKEEEEKEKLKYVGSNFMYQALFWCFGDMNFFILTIILQCRCYCYSHFTGKETKLPKGYVST